MKNDRVIINVSDEDLHFREEERKQIEKLRAKAAQTMPIAKSTRITASDAARIAWWKWSIKT